MKITRVKSVTFTSEKPADIYNGSLDLFAILDYDDFKYLLGVITPEALTFHMDEIKKGFQNHSTHL